MVRISVLKQKAWRVKQTISLKRLEEILPTISPQKYLKVEEKPKIFYSPENPEIIKKRWIRKYKIYLKKHHNYTNHNYLRCTD